MKKALTVVIPAMLLISGCASHHVEKLKKSFGVASKSLTETFNPTHQYTDANGNPVVLAEQPNVAETQPLTKEQKLLRRSGVVFGGRTGDGPVAHNSQ